MENFLRKIKSNLYPNESEDPGLVDLKKRCRDGERGPGKISIFEWEIDYLDAEDLLTMINLQVVKGYNDFYCDSDHPVILDCGANIGISTLRFKQLFPDSKIIAFEPNPEVCDVLRRNVSQNNIKDVDVVEAAVWVEETSMQFEALRTMGGHLSNASENTAENVISVKAIQFANYLKSPIDFIKMDIEGAELEVLRSVEDLLGNVNKMIVEFHHDVNEPGRFAEVLLLLNRAKFKVSITSNIGIIDLKKPFISRDGWNADQYPVLYAWR